MNVIARMFVLAGYFILLPYLSRIGGGVDWVAQYVPPPDKLVFGLLFFGAFSAIPGVVLASVSQGSRPASRPNLVAAFIAMSALTVFFHHDYDLASDAQAAIGLIVWPFYVTAGGLVVFAVVSGLTWLLARLRR